MTWSTLEDAWGNDSQENFDNYYENYQNVNNTVPQQPPPQQPPPQQLPPQQLPPQQPPPQQPPPQQPPPQQNSVLDNRISLLENNINTNNTFINKKLDNLTLKIESEIKRFNSELKKLVISIKTVNNNKLDSYNYQINDETNYFQNVNDIILFVIFGIFIIILMDSMYRILLLKIKNI